MTPTPNNEALAAERIDLPLVLKALDRLVEAHVHRTNPFHDPIASDAQLALRELRTFLATSGQAASAVPELTDARIDDLARKWINVRAGTMSAYRRFARAVLAASPTQPASAPAREGVSDDLGTLAGIRRMGAEQSPPAPRAPSIEPVAEVYHIQHAGLNDDSYATIRLLHRASDQWGLRIRAGTKLYAAPASAGVEEFPLPEHGLPTGVPFEFRSDVTHYAEQYARAALHSYSASLGLQARTEGKV